MGFPHSSVGKESACDAGDPCSILGSRWSAGEGISYPLQYSWASLMAQLVKNLAPLWETWIWSLGWEDSLEKGKTTHCSMLAWRIPRTAQSVGSQRVGHYWATFTFKVLSYRICSFPSLALGRNCIIHWNAGFGRTLRPYVKSINVTYITFKKMYSISPSFKPLNAHIQNTHTNECYSLLMIIRNWQIIP